MAWFCGNIPIYKDIENDSVFVYNINTKKIQQKVKDDGSELGSLNLNDNVICTGKGGRLKVFVNMQSRMDANGMIIPVYAYKDRDSNKQMFEVVRVDDSIKICSICSIDIDEYKEALDKMMVSIISYNAYSKILYLPSGDQVYIDIGINDNYEIDDGWLRIKGDIFKRGSSNEGIGESESSINETMGLDSNSSDDSNNSEDTDDEVNNTQSSKGGNVVSCMTLYDVYNKVLLDSSIGDKITIPWTVCTEMKYDMIEMLWSHVIDTDNKFVAIAKLELEHTNGSSYRIYGVAESNGKGKGIRFQVMNKPDDDESVSVDNISIDYMKWKQSRRYMR